MFQNQIGRFQNISKMTLKKLACLNMSTSVITNVARYQPNESLNHLSSVESSKIEKERGICHIKLF